MNDAFESSTSNPGSARERIRSQGRKKTLLNRKKSTAEKYGPQSPAEPQSLGTVSPTNFISIKSNLQRRLLEEISDRADLNDSDEALSQAVDQFVERILESEPLPLNQSERERLAEELREETTGAGPLAPLLADPAVTDVLVNGPNLVYVERFGVLEKTSIQFRDREHILRVIERIAARVGRRIDASNPLLDARLPDGSRVNATLPPISIDSPTLSIRRFGRRRLRRHDLLQLGMFSPRIMEFLAHAVKTRMSLLVSGGTGTGKSTLLGALCETIPTTERIVTIEDTAELLLDQEHVVRMETRPTNIEGQGLITARDLVINSLRMRPDRIIVGEVRGGEALDMLQALNTGHDGGLSTIHSNSPRDALSRLETMVLMSGIDLPSRAIREQIVAAIKFVVHVRRFEDGVRRIENVSEIAGLEGGTILLNEIFRFDRKGIENGKVLGSYQPTGTIPKLVDDLRRRGISLPMDMFNPSPEGT